MTSGIHVPPPSPKSSSWGGSLLSGPHRANGKRTDLVAHVKADGAKTES